jgi:RNA polymerase sigma-70 factor (ECF subfamily)
MTTDHPATCSWPLDRLRPLLKLRAEQIQLHARLGRRLDASDLVHDAVLRAWEKRDQFRGGEKELLAWLQRILVNVGTDRIREQFADKRDPRREKYLAALSGSAEDWDALLVGNLTSPSEKLERQEELLRLAQALEELPDDQRLAVIARDMLGQSVGEIAENLGKTRRSVAGLLDRGRSELRGRFRRPLEESHE